MRHSPSCVVTHVDARGGHVVDPVAPHVDARVGHVIDPVAPPQMPPLSPFEMSQTVKENVCNETLLDIFRMILKKDLSTEHYMNESILKNLKSRVKEALKSDRDAIANLLSRALDAVNSLRSDQSSNPVSEQSQVHRSPCNVRNEHPGSNATLFTSNHRVDNEELIVDLMALTKEELCDRIRYLENKHDENQREIKAMRVHIEITGQLYVKELQP